MGKPMAATGLLGKHYECLLAKDGQDPSLSDDFSLAGAVATGAKGLDAFAGNVFFRFVKRLEVKTMIIDGENACAVVNYSLISPKGDSFSCDAAEIWRIRNGKLDSMAMYFDTVAYQKFMLPILFPLTRLKRKNRP